MAAVTVAALGVAASAYSANRQSRAAREAADNQEEAMDGQLGLDRERLNFSRQQYDDWRQRFDPIMDDLTAEAYADSTPDYDAIVGDVGAAFDTSQGINRRQQQRYGLQPSDGAVAEGELRYGLGRATAMAGAKNNARTANKDMRFNRLASLYSLGSGQGAAASSLVSAAYAGASGNMGNQAGMFGNQQAQAQQGANQAWGDAAGWAGWGFGQYMGGRNGGGG
jgi:hypothetical protein